MPHHISPRVVSLRSNQTPPQAQKRSGKGGKCRRNCPVERQRVPQKVNCNSGFKGGATRGNARRWGAASSGARTGMVKRSPEPLNGDHLPIAILANYSNSRILASPAQLPDKQLARMSERKAGPRTLPDSGRRVKTFAQFCPPIHRARNFRNIFFYYCVSYPTAI